MDQAALTSAGPASTSSVLLIDDGMVSKPLYSTEASPEFKQRAITMSADRKTDFSGALERALTAVNSDDPIARNDAWVLLEMATAVRHGLSIDFEGLAVATSEDRGDALVRLNGVFDLNAHLKALRAEADWRSLDRIDAYIADRMKARQEAVRNSPATELFRLINAGDFTEADKLHARLKEEGKTDPVVLDDARAAIDNRRWEISHGFR